MRYLAVICLLLGSLVWAQDKDQDKDKDQPAATQGVPSEYLPPTLRDTDAQQALPASAAKVPPDAAVITVKGVCAASASVSDSAGANPSCETVVTRARFEALTDALLANMKDAKKRQVANAYPNLLAMAREAEARGLERNQHFQERLAFARLQILAQELVRQIDQESAKISAEEVEDYYHSHSAAFETATLERIFIPNRKHVDPLPGEKATPEALNAPRKASEDAMTRVAGELRARAVAGAPFSALQKQAYEAAGATDVPPNSSLGQVHPGGLPATHASVFELKPGEISQVLSDATGHYIYKVDAKGIQPLAAVDGEIRKTIQKQRREQALESVQLPVTTEFNPAYFGPAAKSGGSPESK